MHMFAILFKADRCSKQKAKNKKKTKQMKLTKFSDAFPLFSLFTMRIRPDTFSTKVSICERFPTHRKTKIEKKKKKKRNEIDVN